MFFGVSSTFGDDVTKDIISFAFLPHGWNFGTGDPIQPDIVTKALEIHDIGLELELITEATPEVDGSVTLTFVHKEDAVDIRVHPDFTYTVTREKGIGIQFERLARERKVDLPTALQYLYKLKAVKVEYVICESCVSSEPEQLARAKRDLSQSSVLPTTLVASQSWNWSAFMPELLRYAST